LNLLEARIPDHQQQQDVKWVLDQEGLCTVRYGRLREARSRDPGHHEEKRALDALKQSEEKYRNFFESTNDMAYAVTPEGVFMDINEAGLKLLGFRKQRRGSSHQYQANLC